MTTIPTVVIRILILDMIDEDEGELEMKKCTSSHAIVATSTSKGTRKLVYGSIILLAFIIMVFQFYNLGVKLAS